MPLKIPIYPIIFDKTKNGLYFVGFLAYSFLIGQLIVWYHLMNTGYYATTNVAKAFLAANIARIFLPKTL